MRKQPRRRAVIDGRGPWRASARALLAAALLIAPCTATFAERADRQKPIHVESDRMHADDIKQVAVFTGRVVVTQGTFTLCADEVTIHEDKAGNQFGTAVGNPATFREKRDGVDEWIEGEAQRSRTVGAPVRAHGRRGQ